MTRAARPRIPLLAVLILLLGLLAGVTTARTAHAAAATSITLDGTKSGLVFDGVGAISGGGGNSRLLADYPEPQRSQLLDYLFKPGYGAALQTLKIEIGGDTNSTDGAEASHEHTRGAVDCGQGYEWWLAEQAKARNPAIRLYGLAWGAPGWIGGGNFWSQDMIDYLMSWLGCAKQHNLSIDYLGGWNERNWNAGWYENLKSALAANGYGSIKVVAADSGWDVADAMASDPAFKNAVDIVGTHYPCGYMTAFTSCPSTSAAQGLGKPLWASENGSEDADGGAPAVARAINRDYIDGRMTSYINWPVIAALYPNLHYSTDGMSIAAQPWSGNYSIGRTTWVTAQTTQFTKPGWHYIDSASGFLGGDRANGSYVTLKSTNNTDYTTVIETVDATAAQTASFTVTGGLSTGQVHVWSTKVNSSSPADQLAHVADVTPSGGAYSLTLQPGTVYTLTTTTGQGKGTATPPAAAAMALPYSDDFETAATTTSPKYFSDMNGAFQRVACGGGRSGSCVRQMAPTMPIRWTGESYTAPYTIMGDGSWSNYTVAADAMLEQSGSVELLGRVNLQGTNNNGLNAYHFRVADSGAWSIVKSDTSWHFTTLASGTTSALGLNRWHRLSLKLQDTTLTAAVDGVTVGSATDASYTTGQAGLGVTGYQTDQFDNFALTPGTVGQQHLGPVRSGLAGKCLDDNGGSTADGTRVQIWDCNGGAAQTWWWGNGMLRLGGPDGKCLDVTGQGTSNGALVELWECNGGTNQQWTPQADGTLKGVQSGRCLDDPASSTTNGTQLELWDCNGGANQKWTLPG
ncbi:ricin-type beta-trefoil lectin domain protein [Actinoallomurus rhizosphaericola]|uniref:ricin-type beta-trefoil lectin domain protein n=1 Tax=Actinoallomurus rhizosphaericola TaxID=2952536 RepID=UPI0020916C31|nr:ricin-type beta-trefoil lectin domain protein [Actinoallomurus rhizosphaericola]MCO5992040.1 ricin-type beta-trefoil lectin domain protein [Actinoallomurus rhizosphaericola]